MPGSAVGGRCRVTELRSVAGVTEVAVVGIHLGAMLAMTAVARGADIRQMVLWGPAAAGRMVLRELRAAANVERWERLPDEDAPPQPMPGFESGGISDLAGDTASAGRAGMSPRFRGELRRASCYCRAMIFPTTHGSSKRCMLLSRKWPLRQAVDTPR